MIDRRTLLKQLGVTASLSASAGLLTGPLFAHNHTTGDTMKAVATDQIQNIGLQLYTVRGLMANNAAATLDQLAALGYEEVEDAGFATSDPMAFKAMLDNAGLKAPSGHTLLQPIIDTPDTLIETAHTIGQKYIVLAWLTPEERSTLDHYHRHIDVMNAFAEKCHSAGLQLAYHNHDFEFFILDGQRPIDVILSRTDADRVKLELDFYWTSKAGIDTAALLHTNKNRVPLCHVKDMDEKGNMVSVGKGVIDFASLFAAGRSAGLTHYFVEHDNPLDPLESVRYGIETVKNIHY